MGMRLRTVNIMDTAHERFEGINVAAGWIRDLESSDSRTHKERVIEKARMAAKLGSADAQAFLFNCYAAYNPFWTYNIRQVPETAGITRQANPWPLFWSILEALRTRSITGNTAREAIDEMSLRFDSEEWNGLARRVLIKDLRCGISEKTINKVVGKTDWRIPVFTCQLAQDSEGHPAKMQGRKRLEIKLDGVRVLAVVTKNSVTLYSRNGKVFENFPHIQAAIEAKRPSFQMNAPFVLDGEVVGASFQKLMRQARRKEGADTADMVYHIFDIVPLAAFEEGHYNMQQHRRLASLELARPALMGTDCLRIMTGLEVDLDTAAGQDQLRRYSRDAVEQGFEGIMIKDLEAPYQCKRAGHWMKWKPTITVDLRVVGFEEGTGRNKERLGAFICEGQDNGRSINVNVGGGFSDSDRNDFWARRDQLRDFVVEVEADAVTQNQDGSWSLRFPRFLRFRGFEPGEKI
jgi:DNA ligase-1